MMFYRCRCGDNTCIGSMPPSLCDGCPKCGTTLDTHPDFHTDRGQHVMIPYPVKTDEGEKILSRCKWCKRTADQISVYENHNSE